MNKVIGIVMALLKNQSSRIVMYFFAGVLFGNWLGAYYPKQSMAFWLQPSVALVIAIATLAATFKSNKEKAIADTVATFTTPDRAPTEKEAAILAKAGVELPKP